MINSVANFRILRAGRDLCRFVVPIRLFNCQFSPEQDALRLISKEFAANELAPIAARLDKEGTFPYDQILKLGGLGLMSLSVKTESGGLGVGSLGLVLAVEQLATGCASTAAVVSIHNCLYAALLDRKGSAAQKESFLTPFLKGTIGCFALSEPNAGSDVAGLESIARKDGNFWILQGTKAWVTSAQEGKMAVIFANVDQTKRYRGITAFIVPLDTPGLTIGPKDDLLGIRALSSSTVTMKDVRIPNDNLLGQVGEGFRIAMAQLDRARVGIAAQALGIGQAALQCAAKYSLQRKAFGKPIAQQSAVQHRLADMSIRLEGARLLTYRAALELDTGSRATQAASVAKVAASTAANFVADNCVQIMGAVGYAKGYAAERHYRDARVTQIYGGVTDVQKMVIAQQLLKQYSGLRESDENH